MSSILGDSADPASETVTVWWRFKGPYFPVSTIILLTLANMYNIRQELHSCEFNYLHELLFCMNFSKIFRINAVVCTICYRMILYIYPQECTYKSTFSTFFNPNAHCTQNVWRKETNSNIFADFQLFFPLPKWKKLEEIKGEQLLLNHNTLLCNTITLYSTDYFWKEIMWNYSLPLWCQFTKADQILSRNIQRYRHATEFMDCDAILK